MMILETPRLSLRTIRPDDYAALCLFLQDPQVMYAWEHGFSDAEVRAWIDENIMRYARDGYSYWAVIEKASGTLIGVTGLLSELADGEPFVGVGYIYHRRFWHRGFAAEAAGACVEYAFRELGLCEVTAQIRPDNLASRKLAEKLGMQVCKQFMRTYRGKQMPHLLYRMARG